MQFYLQTTNVYLIHFPPLGDFKYFSMDGQKG